MTLGISLYNIFTIMILLKIATRNTKNRSAKNNIAINSSSSTSVGHSNKE